MKRHGAYLVTLFLLVMTAAVVRAGIMLPDVVLHGRVNVNCRTATAADDMTVLARIDGVSDPVGQYRMGGRASIGDRYALRIRLESGADGSAQSNNAARVGDTVHIFVKQGGGAEQAVADYAITEIGAVVRLNLSIASEACPGDLDEDGDVDLVDHSSFQKCLTGPGGTASAECGAADFDNDNDVDLIDWYGFQAVFTGSE